MTAQSYRSLNKQLTIFGCIDRQYFLVGLLAGAGMFVTMENVWLGILTAITFFVVGYYHVKDPVKLRLRFARKHVGMPIYDPGLRRPFRLVIIEDEEPL